MRTLLEIGIEAIHIMLSQITCLCFVHVLKLSGRLSLKVINLVEEILRQLNIQATSWILLGAFSQVYIENWD
jgi:hypothetical protein